MKVAIFSPYATVAPHFETELEIAQLHLDQGDEVQIVSCLGELPNCDFNHEHQLERCQDCIGRRKDGLAKLHPTITSDCFEINNEHAPNLRLNFESIDELQEYCIDDFDVGYAALSSLVSIVRDPEPNLEKHSELLTRFLTSAHRVYRYTLRYISNHTPDRIYNFNGRFGAMRAVLRACQKMGVECLIHERGRDTSHYELLRNHLPHDIEAMESIIERVWSEAGADREAIGASWFLDRVNRAEKSWHSFVKSQEHGRLPANWDSSKHNITIFCSSDDEFVAIGDCWKSKLYENQLTATVRIANSMMEVAPGTQLFLRMHPNVANTDNVRKQQMLALDFPNLTVIAPEDVVDTYALLKSSDKTVSFGSSVGIEAVYWDKPSVLLGPCLYRKLGGTYQPTHHEETITMLCQNLVPQEKNGAIKYGYWFQTRGIPYKYYEPSGLFEGKFKGHTIYAKKPKNKRSIANKVTREIARIFERMTNRNSV